MPRTSPDDQRIVLRDLAPTFDVYWRTLICSLRKAFCLPGLGKLGGCKYCVLANTANFVLSFRKTVTTADRHVSNELGNGLSGMASTARLLWPLSHCRNGDGARKDECLGKEANRSISICSCAGRCLLRR